MTCRKNYFGLLANKKLEGVSLESLWQVYLGFSSRSKQFHPGLDDLFHFLAGRA